MKIAYDAKRITNNLTGLGNYSRFVVNTLAQQYPADELLLFSPNNYRKGMEKLISPAENIQLRMPKEKLKSWKKALWRSWSIWRELRAADIDIYHGLTNELPFSIRKSGAKSIVTVHDLIFLRYPKFYKPIDRWIYNFKFRKACRQADHIVAVSQRTKHDIVAFYGIAPEKISVIYQGCHEQFKQQASEERRKEVAEKFGLPDYFILSVGTVEERKNLLLTVKAMKELKMKAPLVVVGRETAYAEEVKKYAIAHKIKDKLIFLDKVDYTELPVVYQLATLFVYPSLYEGFGIPLIEALHSRVPVIAAIGSCLEEAGGKHSIYVDPFDHRNLALQMRRVMSDSALKERMISEGLRHVQRFEEKQLAAQMHELYERLLAEE